MDINDPGKPPLKDRGNMVTSVVSPKMTEGQNNSDTCNEDIAGKTSELHNGGAQLPTTADNVSSKPKKDTNENAKKACVQGTEHTTSTGEKWKLQFDLSDSASTSDNDGSEVEATDKSGNRQNEGAGSSMLKFDENEDVEDFQGFDLESTSPGIGMVLSRIIGQTETSLESIISELNEPSSSKDTGEEAAAAGISPEDSEEISYHSLIQFYPDEIDTDEKDDVTYTLKVVTDPDTQLNEETMDDSYTDTDATKDIDSPFIDYVKPETEDSTSLELKMKKRKKVKEKEDTTTEGASFTPDVTSMADSTDTEDKVKEPIVSEMAMDTSSLDTAVTPVKGEIIPVGMVTANEEMSSEMTSSAASSPSVSSRGSFKISASGGSSSGRYSRGDSPALSLSGGRGKKYSVDMSNPAFLKPFELGWKRELVYRNTCESSFKKMADIYYYTPAGKKVRSNREVLEYLDGVELTIENFTFFKESLGLNDPSKEIIRDAKKIVAKDPNATPVKKIAKPKLTTPKPSPTADGLNASSIPQGAKGPQLVRTVPPKTFPKIKVSSVKLQRLTPSKSPVTKQKRGDSQDEGEMEIGMLPPMWSPSDSPFLKKTVSSSQGITTVSWSAKNTNIKKATSEPCSIRCVGVVGLIPSLQCRLCLCLYHPECVGLGTITETIHSYVCKNCQQEVKDGKPTLVLPASKLLNTSNSKIGNTVTPPPLTPISALGAGSKTTSPPDNTVGQSAATPSSPPKLQRLPRAPRYADSGKLITVPRFVKVPRSRESVLAPQQGLKGTGNKGTIVGSVTTWLPPSSTIQLSPTGGSKTSSPVTSYNNSVSSTSTVSDSSTTSSGSTSVQALARMGGKKYIVVPKHNVLSVSPAMAATATTPTSKSSVQVGDPSPLGDKAPVTLSTSLVLSNTTGRTSTVLGGTQALVGQPQVLLASSASSNGDQSLSLVQSAAPLTNFVSTGGPLLPSPSALLVSSGGQGGLQNPPGVLLVPFMGTGSSFMSPAAGQDSPANKSSQQQPQQYLIVNGPPSFPSGNFILGNLSQSVKPTDAAGRVGDAGDGSMDGISRDGEEASNKGKRKMPAREYEGPAAKRLKSTPTTPSQGCHKESERQFMQFFMMNVCTGYSSLLHVFQYLKVQELLRAARVCRMWRDVASHPSLWRTVRMKNSQVVDWSGLVKSLRRHETEHLDLRKMLVPSEDTHAMWDEFCQAIGKATSLKRLDLCKCPARVVERVAESCPQLKILNAMAIKCSNIDLQSIGNSKNLQELRLKSLAGITLTGTLEPLRQLSSLKHLSLTTFRDLGKMETEVIGSLNTLETLELGECCDLPEEFGPETLTRLTHLERLRLEKGQGKTCPTLSILAGIATLPKLTHLELVNFDVKPGFDKALAQCMNIRRLLVIPTYVTQSATTNHMVLNGVNHLSETLTHFVWGVTHELLRVTELFVDQCEGQKDTKTPTSKSGKKSWGSDSIPILKPIQQRTQSSDDNETMKWNDQENSVDANKNDKATDDSEEKETEKDETDDAKASAAAPQVEILPLPKLQKLLTSSLPQTKVKILKIPFHATWRQSITDLAP